MHSLSVWWTGQRHDIQRPRCQSQWSFLVMGQCFRQAAAWSVTLLLWQGSTLYGWARSSHHVMLEIWCTVAVIVMASCMISHKYSVVLPLVVTFLTLKQDFEVISTFWVLLVECRTPQWIKALTQYVCALNSNRSTSAARVIRCHIEGLSASQNALIQKGDQHNYKHLDWFSAHA
jgi:hypothetical protein